MYIFNDKGSARRIYMKRFVLWLLVFSFIAALHPIEIHAARNDYVSKYMSIVAEYERDHYGEKTEYVDNRARYRLIHIDNDGIPELVANANCYISVYTYKNGQCYELMDNCGYGAMGTMCPAFLPKKNKILQQSYDGAGIIRFDDFYRISKSHRKMINTDQFVYDYRSDSNTYVERNGRDGEEPDISAFKYMEGGKVYQEIMVQLQDKK